MIVATPPGPGRRTKEKARKAGVVEFFLVGGHNREMDLKIVIGFIFSHYVVIFGTTLALFFTVSMILLIRSIGRDSAEPLAIDVDAIEGAMKRVLATQPIAIAAGSKLVAAPTSQASLSSDGDISGAGEPADMDPAMAALVAERDAKIEALKHEMDELRASVATTNPESVDTSPLTSEIDGLKGKVEELQARLAEYEIIEDDIADLSMFKDENRKLKEEVESLKVQLASAPAAPPPASAAPAEAASLTPALDAGVKFEKTDKFELDLNDDAIKAFAAANGAPITAPPPAAEPITLDDMGSQAEIDAMLKAHAESVEDSASAVSDAHSEAEAPPASSEVSSMEEEAAPVDSPVVDSQAEIDALLSAHAAEPAPPAAPVVHAAPSAFDDLFGADSAVNPPPPSGEPQPQTEAPAPAQAEAAPAAAASAEDEDPLGGSPDPDKMLSEVENLSSAEDKNEEESDALEDALDTDRLLAEVDSLSAGNKSA